jgi:hypothetical protein
MATAFDAAYGYACVSCTPLTRTPHNTSCHGLCDCFIVSLACSCVHADDRNCSPCSNVFCRGKQTAKGEELSAGASVNEAVARH